MEDVLSLLIEVEGASRAVSEVGDVREVIQGVTDDLAESARTASAVAAVATAVSAIAVVAAGESSKAQSQLTALLGDAAGLEALSKVEDISDTTHVATSALVEFESQWIAVGGEIQTSLDLLTAMANAADALQLDTRGFSEMADVLADIQRVGAVSSGDLNRLARLGVPLNDIAKQLGLSDAQSLSGVNSGRFLPAAELSLNNLGGGGLSVINEVAELFKTLKDALEPTGKIIVQILVPLIQFLQWLVRLLKVLNDFTRGWLGMIAITAMFATALGIMIASVYRAATALNTLAVSAGVAGGASGAGAIMSWLGGIVSSLQFVAFVAPVVISAILSVLGEILLVIATIASVVGVLIYVMNGIINLFDGKHFNDGVDDFFDRLFGFFSGADSKSGSSTSPANQPVRRNSIENVWNKANGRGLAT